MHWKSFGLLTITLFILSCANQKNSTQALTNNANSLLWKISGNGLEENSYLYGTIHMSCDVKISTKMIKALDETKQLVLEIKMDDPSLQMKMMQSMLMKDDASIKKLLSEEEYQKVNEFFKENMGMGITLFDKMKPMLVSATIYPKLFPCKMPSSYEAKLMEISKAQNEEVFGLETVADQMSAFDKIPYQEQANQLVEMANEGIESAKETMDKMSIAYNTENLKMLQDLMQEDESFEGDYAEDLLYNRNRNWIPIIEEKSKFTPTLFAVGAAHLPGENGVIDLLQKRGYTVSPVY